MVESAFVRGALRVVSGLVLAFLYLPLVILAIYAFNKSRLMTWPPPGLTLHWFGEAAANPAIRSAFVNSIVAATAATVIALVLGTLASLAVQRYEFFGRDSIAFMLVLPIALPGVITGIALQTTFRTLGLNFGLMTIIIGHATFCVVVAYNNVVARLRRLSRTPEEASSDLGADTFLTFRRITMPGLRTALLSGALLAFALSFDEVIVTLFTAGAQNTLPIWILGKIRLGQQLPEVNAVVFVVILLTVIPVLVSQRLTQDSGLLRRR